MDPQRPVFRGIDLTPELLERQGRTLRALARCLLGDAHAAEDVVQETWVACLTHPGRIPRRLSGWLATVARHLALRRARGEGRRRAREERAAAPEGLEALHERAQEREEALRAVTQALLALEEPYKSALLLRYYEDRSPAEIAELLALPVATVKSRLARGLERMRARLGAEFAGDEGRERRALAVLAGLPAPGLAIGGAGPAAAAVGGLAMGMKLQAAVAALVLAGGALWWWQREPAERRGPAGDGLAEAPGGADASVASARLPSPGVPGDTPPSDAGERRESVAAVEPEAAAVEVLPPEASFRYRIAGQVRDERDQPLAGARVFLAPQRFPLNRVAETDGEGRFVLEFDGRRPSIECAFTVDDKGGRMLGLRELHLVSGQELLVDVGVNPVSNRGRALAEMTAAEAGVLSALGYAEQETPSEGGRVLREGGRVLREGGKLFLELGFAARSGGPLERAPECARRTDGRLIFVDPPPWVACARTADLELEANTGFARTFLSQRLVLDLSSELEGRLLLELDAIGYGSGSGEGPATPVEQASVRGIVRDAAGDPVAGVPVGWRSPRGISGSVESDASGAFVLADLPPGELVLCAGGGDQGLAKERVTITAGQARAWNPLLERGDEVAGRVVLFNGGMPVRGLLVELWSTSPTFLWCDSTLTNEGGRFAIPNVPAGALELHVYASGNMQPKSTFPIRVVRPVFGQSDLGDIVLGKDDVVCGSLEVALLDPQGKPVPGAEVRVWQAATGRGAFALEPDERGKLSLAGLPGGSYRIEAGSSLGWRDLGTVWVDPWAEGALDLGEERCAPPGFAAFGALPRYADGKAPPVHASLWSAHPDVFGRVDAREDLWPLLVLPAGDYVLCGAARDKRCEAALEVRAGETSGLTLELEPSGELVPRRETPEPDPDTFDEASCAACHDAR